MKNEQNKLTVVEMSNIQILVDSKLTSEAIDYVCSVLRCDKITAADIVADYMPKFQSGAANHRSPFGMMM
jgi:hypothetical protein